MSLFKDIHEGWTSFDEIPEGLLIYIESTGSGLAIDTLDKIKHNDDLRGGNGLDSLRALELEYRGLEARGELEVKA